jgi:tetratricopeptide (TPR) repeat protein
MWPDYNDLWDYKDPAGTAEKFKALLAEKTDADPAYRLGLLTQIARTQGLRGDFAEAHRVLDEVKAAMAGDDLVEVRYLLERGRAFNSAREPEKALKLFRRAADLAEDIGEDFYAVDALHMLGIAAPPDQQLSWNREAITTAEASSQPRARGWLPSLLYNTGCIYFEAGEYEQAYNHFRKAVAACEEYKKPDLIGAARWFAGKTLRMLGRVEEALKVQMGLLKEDSQGFTEEEIGECLLALGREAEARPYFKIAYARLSGIGYVAEDVERISRLKELSGA